MPRLPRLAVFSLLVFTCASLSAADIGVRIRFGLKDDGNTDWSGHATVTPGAVERIDGWRFQQTDKVVDNSSWQASTRPLTVRRTNNPAKKAKAKKKGNANGLMADNGVFLVLHDVNEQSVVRIDTKQGNFEFRLADIPYGKVVEKLDGGVDIERVAASRPLTTQRDDDDFPAIAVAQDGTTWVAWVSFTPGLDRDERARRYEKAPDDFAFLAKLPGADRLWVRSQRDGKWSEPIAVTAGGRDIYKCAVALDGKGQPLVIWSENKSYPATALANFDIYAATIANGKAGSPVQLTTAAGTDVCPVAATDSSGRIWIAWQGARDNAFRILERHQTSAGGEWSPERIVSTQTMNCWYPAIAASANGRVAIGWDTYEKGDYDVWVREFGADGSPMAARPAANTPDYEARASVAYDKNNRLWIAWERSGQTWGKDWGALVKKGIPLYRDRQIGLRILDGDKWLEPAGALAKALPGARARRGPANLPVRTPEPDALTRRPGEEAQIAGDTYNNIARLACDRDGRIWLFARSREGTFHTPVGSVWCDYAACYDGSKWTGPVILPHSDNLLYNSPAVAAHPGGGFVVAHSSDHRQDRHVVGQAGGNDGLASGSDPFDNDIYVSRLEMGSGPVSLNLVPAKSVPDANPAPSQATVDERDAIARARAFQSNYDGKTLHIARGEFHRHTEVSGDGGNDGPVEDMWRYAIDVAGMDWLGNGDHDNGAGREYTWWLIQKTTDAFRIPGHFDPPFTYERSVPYPEGHRNVVFAQRGVRTLPRLPKTMAEPVVHAPDTQMLYAYLKTFNGVCASHSSTTTMGTDWRDNDPVYEPMVEIYQGCRQSYERPGAPRTPTADDAVGGYFPLGFINLALKKGYKIAFESSSDHGSTHISYALAYVEDSSREALLRAMRARHTYAATDNIVAEFRCSASGHDYMLGDAFTTNEAPTLRLKLGGTGEFSKVTLIKDDEEVLVTTPNKRDIELTWTDPKPTAGKESYYYFRGEQANGELVWVSPMWITYQPK